MGWDGCRGPPKNRDTLLPTLTPPTKPFPNGRTREKCFKLVLPAEDWLKCCSYSRRRRRKTITVVRLKARSAHVAGSGTV